MVLNRRQIFRILSIAFLFAGCAMLVPAVFAVAAGENNCARAFITLIPLLFMGGFICNSLKKHTPGKTSHVKPRDAYLSIVLGWLILLFLSALPYYLSGSGYSLLDSWFESAASWTTTGATVIDLAKVPRTLLLWRAMNSWFGGLVLLTLSVSLFPKLGISEQQITDSDFTGAGAGKLSPKLYDTLRISCIMYGVITAVALILLAPSGMHPFYAVLNAMTSVSTAGLIDISGTSGSFVVTPYIKTVLTIVVLISSLNFFTYYYIFRRKAKLARENYEVRTYLRIIFFASISMALVLYFSGTFDSFPHALGNAAAQAVSFASTSGFTMDNLNNWPSFCKIMLLSLALIGGCSFSTASGMKVGRAIVFFRLIIRGIDKRIHPNSTRAVTVNGRAVPAQRASSITVFILLYIGVFVIGCVLLGLENKDMETTFTCVIASLTNAGAGFGGVAASDYSLFSGFGRFFTTILMMTGRLEIYPVILLFSRTFWRADRTPKS